MKANVFAAVLSVLIFIVCPTLQAASDQSGDAHLKTVPKSIVKIDLNKADVKILSKSIKGIGSKRAEAIIKYREEHGNFKSIEELAQVRGLGKQFVESHLVQLQKVFTIN